MSFFREHYCIGLTLASELNLLFNLTFINIFLRKKSFPKKNCIDSAALGANPLKEI